MSISSNKSASDALREQLIVTAETYGWSEDIGFEFILWEQLTAEDTWLPVETVEQIKEKSIAAGGWWRWPDGIHRASIFVSMHEWNVIRANQNLA